MAAYQEGFDKYGSNYAVPALFLNFFPGWFNGLAMAAIAIGALVPAAIMSIAAANLFTRNIYKEYIRPNASPKQESNMAKNISLVVKLGALAFIIFLPQEYAIRLQLLGGIWVIQTLPALLIGLYIKGIRKEALIAGWAAGMIAGTWMAVEMGFKAVFPLELFGHTFSSYSAVYALLVNLAVMGVINLILPKAQQGKPELLDMKTPDTELG